MRRKIVILVILLLCLATLERSKVGAQSADPSAQAEALLEQSKQQNMEDHALALQTAQQALAIWQGLADREGSARALAMIGRCSFAQSNLPEAIKNYQQALEHWRQLDNPQEQAGVLIMLGFIENRKGEWSNSIAYYTQAQKLIEGKDEPGKMSQIASGLADIFNENGLPENGLIQYQQALEYARQTPDATDDLMSIWALGSTYYLLKDYPQALANLREALAGVPPGSAYAAICNEYLGRVYQAMDDLPNALGQLQAALDIYTRATNPKEAARVLGLIGKIYQQQGRLSLARQNYEQALVTFRKLSDRINQAAIYYALGSLELKQGNLNLAEDYLRQSIDVTENIRRVSTSRDLTAAFSATVYDRYELYIECLMQQHERDPSRHPDVRAFEISELARGRSLAELLQATETAQAPGLNPQLAAQERSLRHLLRVKEDYRVALLSKPYQMRDLESLDDELSRLEGEYQEVSEKIRSHYPAYEQITRPEAWSLRQIQEQVIADEQTVLLEYALGPDESYVWAVTRDQLKSYRLPASGRINAAAQQLYQLLAASPASATSSQFRSALEDLSRMVLTPVASELHKQRIIVVADGALHYIPFQTLLDPSSNSEPLVANYEIINVPSASILGELRKEATQRQPTKVLAAFGDPEFAPSNAQAQDNKAGEPVSKVQALEIAPLQSVLRDIELNRDSFDPSVIQPLYYARRELAYLRDAASGGEPFIASGRTATREQLLHTDLTQYAILHFATHGLLDPKRPEYSGLLLSTVDHDGRGLNGFVGLQDIYGLRTPVDLVVLSACQTALGKDVRGEGLLGLTRGFMYAGAASVMASLWKVDDEATAELMRQTYANMLQKGMTPAAALRAAQNTIRQRPEWQSPYYWAGFTLQGEYHQIIKPVSHAAATGFYQKIAIGFLLALMVGLACWYAYRRVRKPGARLGYSISRK